MKSKRGRTLRYSIAVAIAAVAAAGLLAGHGLLAMFTSGDEAPVDRLIANVTQYMKKKPDDPEAYYLIGRINALAFSEKTKLLRAFYFKEPKDGKLPVLDDRYFRADEKAPKATPAEVKTFLTDAITHYRAAIKLSPRTALYHLSLASIIESAGEQIIDAAVEPEFGRETFWVPLSTEADRNKFVSETKENKYFDKSHVIEAGAYAVPVLRKLIAENNKELMDDLRDAFKSIWREEAIEHYWLAYMCAIKADIPERHRYTLDTPASQEAAEHYLKLVQARGPTEHEALRIPQIEADLKTLKKRGIAMTPIIFSENEDLPLQNLLSEQRVQFDLDGDGLSDDCPWLKPGTSILVWDPKHTGVISSGRQLFGSVTWWIFWRDGFQALEALDDNHDGVLSGDELRGLGVWRDKNGNGISDPEEVTPIETTQIESIAVHSSEMASPGPSPANPSGLRMKDGRRLPIYDWTVTLARP